MELQSNLGLAPRTITAYALGITDYLESCSRHRVEPLTAGRADVATYVGDLRNRPSPRGGNVVAIDSGSGLANATMQQRLTAVRLFYDFLVEEGQRASNPVGRGRYKPGTRRGLHRDRGILPRFTRLPWVPTDDHWHAVLHACAAEPIRNRTMFALAYDAALRREELCLLRTDDIDPAHRTLRVRAETTKSRRERVVPYSAVSGSLLQSYLRHRTAISRDRGALFLSESRRNHAQPLTLWTWSKVVRAIAVRADVPRFTTHTLRHLCLTDLARSGWELHAIAAFAGHRNTATTLQYIHLSGRDLADRLARGMSHIHEWRLATLSDANDGKPTC